MQMTFPPIRGIIRLTYANQCVYMSLSEIKQLTFAMSSLGFTKRFLIQKNEKKIQHTVQLSHL